MKLPHDDLLSPEESEAAQAIASRLRCSIPMAALCGWGVLDESSVGKLPYELALNALAIAVGLRKQRQPLHQLRGRLATLVTPPGAAEPKATLARQKPAAAKPIRKPVPAKSAKARATRPAKRKNRAVVGRRR